MQMPACLSARGFQSGDDECAARESPWLFAYRRPSEAFGRTFGEGKAIAWFAPNSSDRLTSDPRDVGILGLRYLQSDV